MKGEASEQIVYTRPLIEKGYYAGKLVVAKPLEKDGKPILGKYGKQIILEFEVYDKKDTSKRITYTETRDGAEKVSDLKMATFLYTENFIDAKQPALGFRTAVTPNSRTTAVFEALGWKFEPRKAWDTDEFLGCWVELNIDDYKKEGPNEQPYSIIKDIQALKNAPARSHVGPAPAKNTLEPISHDELDTRLKALKAVHDEGNLTDEGYKQAVEALSARPLKD